MDSVDIVHGLSGHCPWTEWTMSMDSVDIVHGLSGQCSSTQWTLSMDLRSGQYSSRTMSTESMDFLQTGTSIFFRQIKYLSSGRRGSIGTRQRGSGTTIKPEAPGFYTQIFLVPKKNRQLRLKIDLSRLNTFVSGVQNGNAGKSQIDNSNQRLILFPWSDRCLSSCAHAQSISEIPPILHSGSSIPIQISSIRTNNKSVCLLSWWLQ